MGLAWQVATEGGRAILLYGGGTGGFQSFLGSDQEEGMGAVVLTNTRSGDRHDAQQIGVHMLDPGRKRLR